MGRWSWSDRKTVEECRTLSVSEMARSGVFEKGPGNFWTSRWTNAMGEEVASIGYWVKSSPGDGLHLQLSYTITNRFNDEKTPLDYPIELTTTPCNFGGIRYWFICPLVVNGSPCGRRVAKLYLPPGGKYFGCRHCYNLTYTSCKEHDKRVDALTKNPELLLAQMRGNDLKGSLLALKAYTKMMGKF